MKREALVRLDLAPGLTAFALVTALAFADGGFFPETWGWSALAAAAVAGMALLLRRRITLAVPEVVMVAALASFAVWIALSTTWSPLPVESRLEAERALVYVAGLAAAVFVARERSVAAMLGGLLAAITVVCAYSLGNRLLEGESTDPFQGTLLFEPIGYANVLGILAAIGAILAVAFFFRARRVVTRGFILAALAVLIPTLSLTGSRGAWAAAGVGLVTAAGLLSGRLRALALLPLVAVALVLTAGGSSAVDLAGNDRPHYWRVALDMYREDAALGFGGGTFGAYWLLNRPVPRDVRDAHSLYLETLAELGPVGLALLLTALAAPLATALTRHDRRPLVAGAGGAYAAYFFHAGIDWDWEMPAVTLAGLFCGAAILVGLRCSGGIALGLRGRVAAGGAVALLAALALVSLLDPAGFD